MNQDKEKKLPMSEIKKKYKGPIVLKKKSGDKMNNFMTINMRKKIKINKQKKLENALKYNSPKLSENEMENMNASPN